jgi:hypothetical protein
MGHVGLHGSSNSFLPDFDLEVYLLKKGHKRVIKREGIEAGDFEDVVAGYQRMGLAVIEDPRVYSADEYSNFHSDENNRDGYRTLIVAGEKSDAENAFGFHMEESYNTLKGINCLRELGKLLGYPECCIDFFIGLDDKNNNNTDPLETLRNTQGIMNPLLNTFGGWKLIAHTCCSYNCAKSLEIARASFEGIREFYGQDVSDEIMRLKSQKFIYLDRNTLILFDKHPLEDAIVFAGIKGENVPDEIVGFLRQSDKCSFDGDRIIVSAKGQILYSEKYEGLFFNWGGINTQCGLKGECSEKRIIKYVLDVIAPIRKDEFGGYRFSQLELVKDEIGLMFEKPGGAKPFMYSLKERDDNVNRFAFSLNFNMSYRNQAGVPGDLLSILTVLIRSRDRAEISREDWHAARESAFRAAVVWKEGVIFRRKYD